MLDLVGGSLQFKETQESRARVSAPGVYSLQNKANKQAIVMVMKCDKYSGSKQEKHPKPEKSGHPSWRE